MAKPSQRQASLSISAFARQVTLHQNILRFFGEACKKNWSPSQKVCFRTKVTATFSSHLHNDIVMNNATIMLWIMQPIKSGKKKRQKLRQAKSFYRANPSKAQTWSKETPKERSPFHPPPRLNPSSNAAGQAQFLSCGKIRFKSKRKRRSGTCVWRSAIRVSGPPIHSPELRPKSSKTPQKRIYGLILGPWWWKKRPTTQAALIETETWRNKHSL